MDSRKTSPSPSDPSPSDLSTAKVTPADQGDTDPVLSYPVASSPLIPSNRPDIDGDTLPPGYEVPLPASSDTPRPLLDVRDFCEDPTPLTSDHVPLRTGTVQRPIMSVLAVNVGVPLPSVSDISAQYRAANFASAMEPVEPMTTTPHNLRIFPGSDQERFTAVHPSRLPASTTYVPSSLQGFPAGVPGQLLSEDGTTPMNSGDRLRPVQVGCGRDDPSSSDLPANSPSAINHPAREPPTRDPLTSSFPLATGEENFNSVQQPQPAQSAPTGVRLSFYPGFLTYDCAMMPLVTGIYPSTSRNEPELAQTTPAIGSHYQNDPPSVGSPAGDLRTNATPQWSLFSAPHEDAFTSAVPGGLLRANSSHALNTPPGFAALGADRTAVSTGQMASQHSQRLPQTLLGHDDQSVSGLSPRVTDNPTSVVSEQSASPRLQSSRLPVGHQDPLRSAPGVYSVNSDDETDSDTSDYSTGANSPDNVTGDDDAIPLATNMLSQATIGDVSDLSVNLGGIRAGPLPPGFRMQSPVSRNEPDSPTLHMRDIQAAASASAATTHPTASQAVHDIAPSVRSNRTRNPPWSVIRDELQNQSFGSEEEVGSPAAIHRQNIAGLNNWRAENRSRANRTNNNIADISAEGETASTPQGSLHYPRHSAIPNDTFDPELLPTSRHSYHCYLLHVCLIMNHNLWPDLSGHRFAINAVHETLGSRIGSEFEEAILKYCLCRPCIGKEGDAYQLVRVASRLKEIIRMAPRYDTTPTHLTSILGYAEISLAYGECILWLMQMLKSAARINRRVDGQPRTDERVSLSDIVGIIQRFLMSTIMQDSAGAGGQLLRAKDLFSFILQLTQDSIVAQRLRYTLLALGDLHAEKREWEEAKMCYREAIHAATGHDIGRRMGYRRISDIDRLQQGGQAASLVNLEMDRFFFGHLFYDHSGPEFSL